jgi:hypothetical protein
MAKGTKEDPWALKTPPGTSSYTIYKEEKTDPPALVRQVGSTTLRYHARAIEDLHAWLVEQGDWVALGAADEGKPAGAGTVEAWGRFEGIRTFSTPGLPQRTRRAPRKEQSARRPRPSRSLRPAEAAASGRVRALGKHRPCRPIR